MSSNQANDKLRRLRERMKQSAIVKRERVDAGMGSFVDRSGWIEVAEATEYWVEQIDRLLAAPEEPASDSGLLEAVEAVESAAAKWGEDCVSVPKYILYRLRAAIAAEKARRKQP